jgi:hypothetical protein
MTTQENVYKHGQQLWLQLINSLRELSMQAGQGASNIAPQNIIMLQNVTQGLGLGWYQNLIWDIKYQESL